MSSVLINFFTKFTSNSGRFNLGWTVAWSGCPEAGSIERRSSVLQSRARKKKKVKRRF
jgi:hypothetical protein